MKKGLSAMLVIAGISIWYTDGQAQMTGRDVMQKVDTQQEYTTQIARSKMVLINKAGKTRERDVLRYEKSYNNAKGIDTKALIFFEAPADIRGTGLLIWGYTDPQKDDDRWLYLPALKKVRRIAGESKDEYFMGTDFTYDDIGGREVDQDMHKLLGQEDVDGVKCYKLESVPVNKNDMYGKKIAWVIPEKWVVARVEFYDKKGVLMKELKASDVRNVNGIWTAFVMRMDNYLEKHQTVLEIKEIKYNQAINDEVFTTITLERGQVR